MSDTLERRAVARSNFDRRGWRARLRRRQGIRTPFDIPPVSSSPNGSRDLSWARFAIFFTITAWIAYGTHQVARLAETAVNVWQVLETVTYMGIVALLTVSALSYLVARLGHMGRARDHTPTPRVVIDEHFFNHATPSLTVLVPSYREDERVIRQTLLSAALQEYEGLEVVLLIDDPPNPSEPAHVHALDRARALPEAIEHVLRRPHVCHLAAADAFDARVAVGHEADQDDLEHLAVRYHKAARYLRRYTTGMEVVDHQDEFLQHAVLFRLVDDFERTAAALNAAVEDRALVSTERVSQLYRRLARVFDARVTCFERKRYASLSHEANKAMNLNSYLGLMGGHYRVQETRQGDVLILTEATAADLHVREPDYVLTLDADSMVLPEYCLRLVHLMEQPEHRNTAVIQTPYSAYPGARSRVERIAGATTDLQRLVHQGLTRYGASFWVGANAILRKSALDDIARRGVEDGFAVTRYIQDRTVVEDTESSIDIAAKGWTIHNYPGRLSYSATPPDFGSLCVQRQRWANGGLVIMPKLFGLGRDRVVWRRFGIGWWLRANYLASIAWASLGLLFLLAYPYNTALFSPFAVLTALPYFVAMSTDLRRTGYRRSDVFRVYGFNLLLLPVNLAGVLQSIGQAIGGHKIAFARTPKVRNRTVAPLMFIVVPYALVMYSAYTLWGDLDHGRYLHAGFAGVNVLMAGYAIVAFVGLRHSIIDILLNLRERIYAAPRRADVETMAPDWATVLYQGSADPHETPSSAQASTLALLDQTQRHGTDAQSARSATATPGNGATTAGPFGTAPSTGLHATEGKNQAVAGDVSKLIDHLLATTGGVGSLDIQVRDDGVHILVRPSQESDGAGRSARNGAAQIINGEEARA
jgi:cellulose synthase (UDP-forming)